MSPIDDSADRQPLLGPLLESLDLLESVARRLHPGRLAAARPLLDERLCALQAAASCPAPAAPRGAAIHALLAEAVAAAGEAAAGLADAAGSRDELPRAYRALRGLPAALERLYPLAGLLEAVNQQFLEPAARGDPRLRLPTPLAAPPDGTGVMQFGDERGGFWLYVPERAPPPRGWPLVMALHGGGGDGRQYLWRWLRTARSRGLVVAAPTALGRTWSIAGDDVDSPNLAAIVDWVRGRWPIDGRRLLLSGLSDGGTFTYTSGLDASSPFTHLAPVGANFVAMLLTFADAARVAGLPVHAVHGALDWMFPVAVARDAVAALQAAGARAELSEVADASHVHPIDLNTRLVDWLLSTDPSTPALCKPYGQPT